MILSLDEMRTRFATLFSFSCLRRHDLLIGNLKKVVSDGTAGEIRYERKSMIFVDN